MKYSYVMAALAAPVVIAAPSKRQSTNIDTTVLQFALTLEHLENVFYKGALQKFSQSDFMAAGYGPNYYNNLKYIANDEQSHVLFLQQALTAAGQTPTAACTYNFPYTDVNSFVTLSSVLEGVGTSAYLGGAPLITSKNYLTAAGSILVAEALHTSLQRSAVNEVPFANPYGTPLDPTSVYTLASAFIKSCPPSNPTLPFTPFPGLTLKTMAGTCEEPNCYPGLFEKRGDDWESYGSASSTATSYAKETSTEYHSATETYSKPSATETYSKPSETSTYGSPKPTASSGSAAKNMPAAKAGMTVDFTAASNVPAGSFLTFVSGLMVVSVPATINGADVQAPIPSAAMGQTYVFVTKNNVNGTFADASVLFGPAILEVAPGAPMIDYSEQ